MTCAAAGLMLAVLLAGGPDAGGYRWVDSDSAGGPEFGWLEPGGNLQLLPLGDDDNVPCPIGFSFQFYDTTHDWLRVCSNGWLSFCSESHQFHHYGFPNPRDPNALIAPLWADLDPAAAGSVYVDFTVPRRFVLYWEDVPVRGTQDHCTFQVVLDTTGTILFQYLDVPDGMDSCSAGVEDHDGLVGLEYLCDGMPPTNRLHDSLAVRFHRLGHDVLPTRFFRPYDQELAGAAFAPVLEVWNAGRWTETLAVSLRVGEQYQDSVSCRLDELARAVLSFGPMTLSAGTYELIASTSLVGDECLANDTLRTTIVVADTGELRYDDGVPDTTFLRIGSPSVDWAAAVRFSSPFDACRLTGARLFVADTQPFARLLVCPDSGGAPDLRHPWFEAESVRALAPDCWLEVGFEHRLDGPADAWLVAYWPRRATGPAIGDDRTPVIEERSFFGSTATGWIMHGNGDLLARLRVDARSAVTEHGPQALPRVSVEPNPAPGRAWVRGQGWPEGVIHLVLVDATGRLVRRHRLTTRSGRIDWRLAEPGLTAGVYWVVLDGAGTRVARKLLLTQ